MSVKSGFFIRNGGSETPEQWLSLTGPMAQNDTDYSSLNKHNNNVLYIFFSSPFFPLSFYLSGPWKAGTVAEFLISSVFAKK